MQIPLVEKTILSNGLTIISETIPSLKSVAVGILVGAGSADELDGEEGLTHFIEHMAFKGTPKRSAFQIASDLDSVGGRLNAYTSKEYTLYYAMVLDRHLGLATDVLSDIFLNPSLKPEDIDMERGVILEEINMYEDAPDDLIHDIFINTIVKGHPKGRPTLGTKKTVASFTRESFLNYRNRLYKPNNVIVSGAGNLTHKEFVAMVKAHFDKFEGAVEKREAILPTINSTVTLTTKKTEQVHLCLGTQGISQFDDRRYVLSIIETILGGSMSSWLFQEIREKRGLAYTVYSSALPFADFGLFYVYAGTEKKNLEQVVALIIQQFAKVKEQGFSDDEIARAKEHLKGGLVLGLESSSARMSYIGKTEFYYKRGIPFDEIFEKVDAVTKKDIHELAQEIFDENRLTLTVIGDLEVLPDSVKKLSLK